MWKKAKRGFDLESRASQVRELLARVGDFMGSKPTKGNVSKYHAHELFSKFFLHAASAIHLRGGSAVERNGVSMIDTASIYVVVRSAVEAYLTFAYIFVLPGDAAESQLRYLAWWREGLITRQKIAGDIPQASEIMAKERENLSENESKITGNTHFQKLSASQRRAVVDKGRWRFIGWGAIARACGLNDLYSYKAYSFLSAYAHSESASVMQTSKMYNDLKEEEFADNAISLLIIVSAKMIDGFLRNFPEATSCLSDQEKEFINRWIAGGSLPSS